MERYIPVGRVSGSFASTHLVIHKFVLEYKLLVLYCEGYRGYRMSFSIFGFA